MDIKRTMTCPHNAISYYLAIKCNGHNSVQLKIDPQKSGLLSEKDHVQEGAILIGSHLYETMQNNLQ